MRGWQWLTHKLRFVIFTLKLLFPFFLSAKTFLPLFSIYSFCAVIFHKFLFKKIKLFFLFHFLPKKIQRFLICRCCDDAIKTWHPTKNEGRERERKKKIETKKKNISLKSKAADIELPFCYLILSDSTSVHERISFLKDGVQIPLNWDQSLASHEEEMQKIKFNIERDFRYFLNLPFLKSNFGIAHGEGGRLFRNEQ